MLELLKPLLEPLRPIRFSSGSTILHQGEVPRGVYVIKSGTVKAFNIAHSGEEQIITYNIAGEFFPTPWLFNKAPSTIYYYSAAEPTEIYTIDKTKFLTFMRSEVNRSNTLIDYYVTAFSSALIRVNALEQITAVRKVLFTLYYLSQRFGKHSDTTIEIQLKLTQQSIADMTGLTRETVSGQLKALRQLNVFSISNHTYLINFPTLLSVMGEESFEDINLK